MLDLEKLLSRREFLIGSAALAPTLLFPELVTAQPKPRYIFDRSLPNLESLSLVPLEQYRINYTPSIEEQARDIEYAQRENPILQGRKATHVESHADILVRFEPNSTFANMLIEEAKKSIDHLVQFLQSSYIPPRKINFVTPQTAEDTNPSSRGIWTYLVADVIESEVSVYKFEGVENNQVITTKHSKEGWIKPLGGIVKDMLVLTGFVIFYKTSSNPLHLVEVPAAEVLHSYMMPYTIGHAIEELKATGGVAEDLSRVYEKYKPREEKFVHALHLLWLRKYNRDRNLGFSEEEIDTHATSFYETRDLYKGVGKLAQYITKIGMPKAIELYIKNPDALFKGAGIK